MSCELKTLFNYVFWPKYAFCPHCDSWWRYLRRSFVFMYITIIIVTIYIYRIIMVYIMYVTMYLSNIHICRLCRLGSLKKTVLTSQGWAKSEVILIPGLFALLLALLPEWPVLVAYAPRLLQGAFASLADWAQTSGFDDKSVSTSLSISELTYFTKKFSSWISKTEKEFPQKLDSLLLFYCWFLLRCFCIFF